MKLSKNERKVLEVLAEQRRLYDRMCWMFPTNIGLRCDKPYRNASSWACLHLRKLRDRGLVKWRARGLYSITEAGLAAMEGE